MNTKNITVVKPGADESNSSEHYDIMIQPGHTGVNVIDKLGFKDSVLSKGNGLPINMTEDIFPLVDNGEKLFATTPAQVGEIAA